MVGRGTEINANQGQSICYGSTVLGDNGYLSVSQILA